MKNRKNSILYGLSFLAFFKPFGFNQLGILDSFANIIKILIFIFLLLKFAVKILNHHKIKNITFVIMSISAWILLSNILNHADLRLGIPDVISCVGVCLIFELYFQDLKEIIRIIWVLFKIYIFCNFISIIVGGWKTENWLTVYFLGSKNHFTIIFPVIILIGYLFTQLYHAPKREYWIVGIVILCSILLTQSKTMIVELAVMAILWFAVGNKRLERMLNYKFFLICYAVFNMLLLISGQATTYINSYLDTKTSFGSMSFLARQRMWKKAILLIKERPLLGWGKFNEERWQNIVGVIEYKTQLHNQIIDMWVIGGLLLVGMYISLLLISGKNLIKYKDEKSAYLISITCFMMLIASLSNAWYAAEFYFPFILACYYNVFIEQMMEKDVC